MTSTSGWPRVVVLVSTSWSRDVSTSHLGLVSVSGGEHLGLELLRLVPIPGLAYCHVMTPRKLFTPVCSAAVKVTI